MQSWIKFVPRDGLVAGNCYFIAKCWNNANDEVQCLLMGRGLNGKSLWTEKPGIAIHAVCNEKFFEHLDNNDTFRAIEIPKDHATRWKARKRKF